MAIISFFSFLIKYFFTAVFFPFYLCFQIFKFNKSLIYRFTAFIAGLLIILPLWVNNYYFLGLYLAQSYRLLNEPIEVSGTGSMYPTFPKGTSKDPLVLAQEVVDTPLMTPYPTGLWLFGKKYFSHEIGRGDIVVFSNQKTQEITQKLYGNPRGYVKRVIGLPGDNIKIQDGLVYINDNPFLEPYTALARSTFGGDFLSDCESITIPEGKLFVMGDNRKESSDSRHEIELIDYQDIDHVLSLDNQKGTFDKHWRDTSQDLDENSKIKLDVNKFISLLNQKRQEINLKPLKSESKLNQSAGLRAKHILKYNDFSVKNPKNGFGMDKALSNVGYHNIVWGEAPAQGYYDAQELIDYYFQFAQTKEFLLNKDFQEIGIAQVEGEINSCPTQIIVQHFAGYIPPSYKSTDIESWRAVFNNLKEVQSSWQSAKDNPQIYEKNKKEIDRINEIIIIRLNNLEDIVKRMESNQWLTSKQIDYTYQDSQLYLEQKELVKKINDQIN